MAIQTISYQDKVALNQNSDIADINKCNASDLNEIKYVVNNIANNIGDLTNLETEEKDSIVNSINNIVNFLEGTILYQNSTGASSTFTINDDISNYSKILITYSRTSRGQMFSALLDIEEISDSSIPLSIVDAGGSNFIIYGCRISFSGTTATITNNGAREVLSSSATFDSSGYNISINKIIGYK